MKLKVIRTTAVRIIIWFFVTSIGSVLLFRWLPVPVTPLMLIRCCEQSMDGKAIRLDKKWKSLDEMGVAMPKAVIASEDQKFEEHFGFDLEAIRKARKYNERHSGKKMKGASTISQQTAKNLFLWPSRSWVRKGFEVYFTFLIELIWSKERILEVYLNIIEMGDGVYGAEAASQTYFRKSCEKISSHEAALIAAVLPNPRRWSPARPSAYIRRRAGAIHQMMSKVNYGLE